MDLQSALVQLSMTSKITVLEISDAPSYLDDVKSLGKQNSASLGLFPAGAFEEHAQKNQILIALNASAFCGYLLFRASRKPYRISIVQLCISENARGLGCSEYLINSLKELCKEGNYSGISLSCRNDYSHARLVWERNQFSAVSEKAGRGRLASVLTTWWWKNPAFVDLLSDLEETEARFRVVIDLNILIELKEFETSTSSHLTSSWLLDEIRILVTPEIYNEIDRTLDSTIRKDTKAFAQKFDCIDCDSSEFKVIFANLSDIIVTSDKKQNISDKRQLVWSILGEADYFLTRDSNFISKSKNIAGRYSIQVLEPERLALSIDQLLREEIYFPSRLSGTNYKIVKSSERDIQRILTTFVCHEKGERKRTLKSKILNLCNTVGNPELKIIENGYDEVQAAFGYRLMGRAIKVELLRVSRGKLKDTIGMQTLDYLIDAALKSNCSCIVVDDPYQSLDSSIFGYFGLYKQESAYIKIIGTGLHNLNSNAELLHHFRTRLNIPEDMLPNRKQLPEIGIETERMFWPLKIDSKLIKNYVIPIKPEWAKQLFDAEIAEYDLFGADPALQFNVENVYYSASNMTIEPNSRILWYVTSDPREPQAGALRAISYVDEVMKGVAKALFSKYHRLGVYKWKDILNKAGQRHDRLIMAIRFSRTEMITKPVSYQLLQEISNSYTLKNLSVQSPQLISVDMFSAIYNNHCTYIQ